MWSLANNINQISLILLRSKFYELNFQLVFNDCAQKIYIVYTIYAVYLVIFNFKFMGNMTVILHVVMGIAIYHGHRFLGVRQKDR